MEAGLLQDYFLSIFAVLLGAFYVCFYTGLALFYMSLWFLWTLVILNRDSPEYSGPEDGLAWTPGVSHIPILDSERASTLIYYKRSNDTQIGEIKDLMYNTFLECMFTRHAYTHTASTVDTATEAATISVSNNISFSRYSYTVPAKITAIT